MKLHIIVYLIIHLTNADDDDWGCCQDLYLTTDVEDAPIGIVGPWSSTGGNTTSVSDEFHSLVGNHSLKRVEGDKWRLDPSERKCIAKSDTTTEGVLFNPKNTMESNTADDKNKNTTVIIPCATDSMYPVWWAEGTLRESCESKNSTTDFATQ